MNTKRRSNDASGTRNAILDATAAIMREEGYAAVSSRRVEERAGFKSKLVHYHFKSMDELFLALFQRADTDFQLQQEKALSSSNPVGELWQLWKHSADNELVAEFIALANHRKEIREEIRRANDRTREIQSIAIAKALEAANLDPLAFPPDVMAFMMAAVARTIATERGLGSSSAHQASVAYIEQRLKQLDKLRKLETTLSEAGC